MRRPEQAVQKTVIAHLAARAVPGAVWFAIPNGGARSPIEAAIMKGTGTMPGIPDLCVIHSGQVFFLELKAPGGKLSKAQVACQGRLVAAGADVATAEGLDAAIAALESWHLLRGRADLKGDHVGAEFGLPPTG